MGLYDNLNSAWQVHDVMRQFAEQQEQENRMIQNSISQGKIGKRPTWFRGRYSQNVRDDGS